jgi:small-conductance mechanosensitive channel
MRTVMVKHNLLSIAGRRLAPAMAFLCVFAMTASAETTSSPAESLVAGLLQTARLRLNNLGEALLQGPGEVRQLWVTMSDAMASGNGIITLTYGLILLLIAGGGEWLYWTYAASTLRAIEATPVASPRQAFKLTMRRLALMGFGLTLFAIAMVGSAAYFDWPSGFDSMVIAAILLIVTIRVIWLIADIIAAPGHPQLRLASITPRQARAGVGIAVVVAFLLAVGQLLSDLLEKAMAPHAAEMLHIVVATLLALIALAVALSIVKTGNIPRRASQRVPPKFPVSFLVTAVILGIYGIWLAGGTMLAVLLADIVIVAVVQAHLRPIVFFFWSDGMVPQAVGESENEVPDHNNEHDPAVSIGATESGLVPSIVLSLTRYGVVIVGIAAALFAIGVPMTQMAASENPLTRLILHLLGVAGLALATNIAWIALRVSIDRRLRALAPDDLHGEPGPNARLLTLLPLLRTTSAIVFLVLLVLSALWTLGIQITPLLAGAGVFGLALGFGAQALVRDIISGIFYLVEDVFRVGEYIESGSSTKGTVERITLRTVALRHHNGPLHFVPYGSLGTVRNNSRDWVVEKFDLPLPVNIDSEQVRKLIKKVGEAMLVDPEVGPKMREQLKAKLYRIDPGVKIFRCKFQTAPGHQFDVRAQAYRRIEATLKEAGIRFADGTQTVLLSSAPVERTEMTEVRIEGA